MNFECEAFGLKGRSSGSIFGQVNTLDRNWPMADCYLELWHSISSLADCLILFEDLITIQEIINKNVGSIIVTPKLWI